MIAEMDAPTEVTEDTQTTAGEDDTPTKYPASHWDIWGDVLLFAGRREEHPDVPHIRRITQVLDRHDAIHDRNPKLPLPPIRFLRRSLELLESLPDESKRKIFNGWAYRPAATRTRESIDANNTHRKLGFGAHITTSGQDVYSCAADWHFGEMADATDIYIRFGATQEDTIAELKAALAAVENHWEKIINPK